MVNANLYASPDLTTALICLAIAGGCVGLSMLMDKKKVNNKKEIK